VSTTALWTIAQQIEQLALEEKVARCGIRCGGEGCTMEWQHRVVIDPDILVGKPVIKGTRIAVEFIIDLLAQGWTEADILRNYPGVTRDDIQACLAYASTILKAEKVYPFAVHGG
jgi:uncharacterized protein (DUF433 family)